MERTLYLIIVGTESIGRSRSLRAYPHHTPSASQIEKQTGVGVGVGVGLKVDHVTSDQ